MRNAGETASLSGAASGETVAAKTTVGAPPTMFCIEAKDRHSPQSWLCVGAGVRIGLEVRAGVHDHAELGEQQRQRQHMHEPTAIASNQERPPARQYPRAAANRQLKPS